MSTDNTFDVIIVGSGHAGANLAYLLAKEGKKVLIMEAGPEDLSARQDYMENFYLNTFKSPSSPYPPDDNALDPAHTNAPRPTLQSLVEAWDSPEKSYLTYEGASFPFGSSYERVAGGTGVHWMGTCLRMSPHDFRLKTRYGHGLDWPLGYEDLQDAYGHAEHLIGVSADVEEQERIGTAFPPDYQYPMPGIPKSYGDQTLSAIQGDPLTEDSPGLKTQITATPAGRNSIPYQNRRVCHGNTNCTPICPIQAKYDPTVTLKLALDTGNVTIRYQCVVYSIDVNSLSGLINSVYYIQYDDVSVPAARPANLEGVKATAPIFVLAAHAIENAKILLNSARVTGKPIANRSDQVGRNLMDHPTYLAWGLLPSEKRFYGYRGPLSTAGVESLRDGNFRKDRAAWRIEIGNEGWNWSTGDPYTTALDYIYGLNNAGLNENKERHGNKDFVRILNDYLTRQFRVAFLVEQDANSNNRVKLSDSYTDNLGIPRPLLNYTLSEYSKKGFESARAATQTMMSRLKATNYTQEHWEMAKRPGTWFEYNGVEYVFNGAGHVCGTHIMGGDPTSSVVNSNQLSWDHQNLYIVGCGSMPSIGTENPTLTLLALTWRTSRDILKRI